MTKLDWEVVTNYIEAVGTSDTVFPFKKTQGYVKVTNTGNANLTYTIGSKTGTLSPGQNIAVSESINSFTLRSASGTQPFQVYATEAGTEKDEADTLDLSSLSASLATKAAQSDLNIANTNITNLQNTKADKSAVTNVMTPKGTIAYASLPTTGNTVGWYYYCPDGDGTHGAGNYVWNGTAWYFGGTGNDGYNIVSNNLKGSTDYLLDKLGYIQFYSGGYIASGVTVGTAVSLNPVSSTTYLYAIVNCIAGDQFSIIGQGGNTPKLYAFLDSSNNLLFSSENGAIRTTAEIITAPTNAVKLILNVQSAVTYKCKKLYSKYDTDLTNQLNLSGLSKINFVQGYYIATNVAVGATVNVTPVANASYWYALITCDNIGAFIISGQGGATPRLYAFLDANNALISVADASSTLTNVVLKTPSNAKYLVINTFSLQDCYYYSNYYYLKTKPSLLKNRTVIVAASNSSIQDKLMADYVCTGTNDETVINAAIASLTYGGTIEFCDGQYEISACSITENTWNYAIFCGYTGYDRHIIMKGQTRNKWYMSNYGCVFHLNTAALATGVTNILIGGSANKWNNTIHAFAQGSNNIDIENIYIKVSSFDKPVIGIDLRHFGLAKIKNVTIENDNSINERYNHLTISIPNSGMIGIYALRSSQETQIFENVVIHSFYEGIHFGGSDHTICLDVMVARCVYGYVFDTLYKTITLINCSDEGNTYMPKFIGSGSITAIDFNVERYDTSYPILTPTGDRRSVEDTPGSWHGTIDYRLSLSGTDYVYTGSQFFVDGNGKNIKCTNLNNPKYGTSPTTSTPEFLQQYFHTATNKMLTWNGTNWVDGSGTVVL